MKIKSGVRVIKRRGNNLDLRSHPAAKNVKGKLALDDFERAIHLAETLVMDYTMCPPCAITAGLNSAAAAVFSQTRSVKLCEHCKSMLEEAMADAKAKRPPFSGRHIQ